MFVSKCHSIFILCLVIIVIKGNSISIDNDSENGIAKDDTAEEKESVEWDEDPYRWDEEVQVVNPSNLILTDNVSVDAPHYEPLVAAIDFGRNDFGEDTKTANPSGTKVRGDSQKYSSLSYGDKISASNVLNKNRRRKVERTKVTTKKPQRKKT